MASKPAKKGTMMAFFKPLVKKTAVVTEKKTAVVTNKPTATPLTESTDRTNKPVPEKSFKTLKKDLTQKNREPLESPSLDNSESPSASSEKNAKQLSFAESLSSSSSPASSTTTSTTTTTTTSAPVAKEMEDEDEEMELELETELEMEMESSELQSSSAPAKKKRVKKQATKAIATTLPAWLQVDAQIQCKYDGKKYKAVIIAISAKNTGFCIEGSEFNQHVQDRAERFGDQPGVMVEYLSDDSVEIIVFDDVKSRISNSTTKTTNKRNRSSTTKSSSKKKRKSLDEYDSDFVVDDDAMEEESEEDDDDDDDDFLPVSKKKTSSKRKHAAFEDDEDEDEVSPVPVVVSATAKPTTTTATTTTTTTATTTPAAKTSNNWLSNASASMPKRPAVKKTTLKKHKPARRASSSSYSSKKAKDAASKDPYKYGTEFGDDLKRKKWTQEMARKLPGITEPQQMFDDMVSKVPEIGKVAERLQGRSITVATMCSGTEAPVLALEMIAKSAKKLHDVDMTIKTVFSCEIEEYKQAYIERNFAPPILFRDAEQLQFDTADTAYGSNVPVPGGVDILIAGTSCKDASSLNNHKQDLRFGSGESTRTYRGMLGWVTKHRPGFVVLENVVGAPWRLMCSDFDEIGYQATYSKNFDTKSYYCPQTRTRG